MRWSSATPMASRTSCAATSSSPRASTPATSYSVLQLIVSKGDVEWAGGATRVAKDIGVPARADVKAIVDKANADDRRFATS